MSEIRYNRLEDSYVIIAPERLHRPDYMAWSKEDEKDASCPFCEGNEAMTPSEIYAIRENGSFKDEKGWHTRVVPNLFKAVQIEAPYILKHEGANKIWDGFGAHEIIIDMPKHFKTMSEWSQTTYFYWLKTIQARVTDLKKDIRVTHISVFKNNGASGGASQSHPHTQLIGLPVIPRNIERKYERIHSHYMSSGRILMDDIIEEERVDGRRVVRETDSFIAFCPFASEYPFEVMITSSSINAELDKIEDIKLEELSKLLQELFTMIEMQLGNFDFNISISIAPIRKSFDVPYRFEIRIMPRIYRHGGFELSSGSMINPVEPERCAELLRESCEK
ncbi:MAG: galactose-1-phosphate uridylyltransferase [Campylobacterales bacterium]|nr:galactose-1-phosphate uridylyltransferase [Campylobacterales bacterium]